jgi:single-stranded DNA-specific DHH superfamily exonuclease
MIDGKDSLATVEVLSKQVAEAIIESEAVRLISHNDADGLSAAGIMCNALYRKGIRFHTTIVSQFEPSTLQLIEKSPGCPVILCDMGSGQVELTSKIKDVIVIDHHKPTGKLEGPHFNPHLAGINGASELCASCSAYMVARKMGDNIDLAGLAIVGAIGDKQPMKGANKFILDEAIEKKVVTVKKGLRLGDDPLEELLEYSFDPYLDITGDKAKVKAFIDEIGIKGRIKDLPEDEVIRLASIFALKLAKQGSVPAINTLMGESYSLDMEVVSNVYDFVNMLNACGKEEKSGIGLSVCMREKSSVSEALLTAREHQRAIIAGIKKAEAQIRSAKYFRYVHLNESSGTGIISEVMTRYRYPDKPFITLNEVEDKIKISARGTRKLVTAGLDLAAAMREASTSVGGTGGGHDVASGATIPKGTAEQFIETADAIIGKQLRGS